MISILVAYLYNYTYWASTERRRTDGPHNGRPLSRMDSYAIDETIREFIEDRVATIFEDRPDDVSGASAARHYAVVQQSGDYCCRGQDRLLVRYSCNLLSLL